MKSIRFLCLTVALLFCGITYAADTDYTNEQVSITWAMTEGEENSAAVLSDKKTIMDYSWSTGSGIGVSTSKTKTVNGMTFTEFYADLASGNTDAKVYNSTYYIEWTLTPYDALTFQPTQVTVNAAKFGTDNPNMYVFIVDGEGEIHTLAEAESMGRQDGKNNQDVVRTFDASSCAASKNAVKLRICINKFPYNKTIGFANVKIEGRVTGTSHYREEYAVNIAANNSEWGTVRSSRSSVVEGTAVTLTAAPNRGYRFTGWTNSENEIVSTDMAYTFVPEATVNLTAAFEPLTEYQVNVTSNIAGAGNVSVTTFDDGKYYEGDVVEIQALPNMGYVFNNWSDNISAWKRDAVTLSADINLTANFEAISEPKASVRWAFADNTDAENTGNANGSFGYSSVTEQTTTVEGHAMRLFTSTDGGYGYLYFNLGVSPEEGQVFVIKSIELDAARAGSSYGKFSISVGGNSVASDIYPGYFASGVDHPYQHYYFNLGDNMEFTSDVSITLSADQMSTEEGKGLAFGNIIVQGYYKTKQVKVTIPSTGYTTYSSPYALSFSGTGVTSYVAQYDGDKVNFSKITDVPENTGLLLKGDAGSYWIPVIELANTVDDNVLLPYVSGGTLQPTDDGVQNMALINKITGLGFHTFENARTIVANSAYMQLPSSTEINVVYAPDQSFVLDETATSAPIAHATGASVTVKRTIAANEWSTICLPFSMNATQVKNAFGNNVELAKIKTYEANSNLTNIEVIFDNVDLSSAGLEANKPYIIKASKNVSQFTVSGVDMEPDEEKAIAELDNGKGSFKGTYHAQTVIPENGLFISNNMFWYSVGLTKSKGFRGYFEFDDVLAEQGMSGNNIAISFGDTATGVTLQTVAEDAEEHDTAIYNLQGQRVTVPTKGIFVKAGKKIIIR